MAPFELVILLLRCALALMFVVMGVLHFVPAPARTMAAMIPARLSGRGIRRPIMLVYLTGVCEIAGGVGLLIPGLRPVAGVALAVFLVAVFPANAHAATQPERFGRAAIPLVPRLIGQVVLIVLVLVAAFAD
jgi:uncharacterized membrane protein